MLEVILMWIVAGLVEANRREKKGCFVAIGIAVVVIYILSYSYR